MGQTIHDIPQDADNISRQICYRHFSSTLSINKHHSVNTQKSALNALVFFLTKVYGLDVKGRLQFASATKGRKISEVLSPEQVQKLFLAQWQSLS